ncbi:hypothetical protein [Fibrobacter intestinalis]|uniref:hypothetical protein n=1 Tax=Fibrobacter sp. NR9 TaxID=1896200 RepID=UPI00099ACA35|nr:hypothetical protein [Fibrobacter sp. NR9]
MTGKVVKNEGTVVAGYGKKDFGMMPRPIFCSGRQMARCRDPFFARDGKWHDAATRFLLGTANGTMPRPVFCSGRQMARCRLHLKAYCS